MLWEVMKSLGPLLGPGLEGELPEVFVLEEDQWNLRCAKVTRDLGRVRRRAEVAMNQGHRVVRDRWHRKTEVTSGHGSPCDKEGTLRYKEGPRIEGLSAEEG